MSSDTFVTFKFNYTSTRSMDEGAHKTVSIKPESPERIVSKGNWALEYWEEADAECRLTWTTSLALTKKVLFSKVVLTSTEASESFESLAHDEVKSKGKACGWQWALKLHTQEYGSEMTLNVTIVLSNGYSGGPEKSKRLASWVPGVFESHQFFNVAFSFGEKKTLHSNSDFLSAASPYFKTLFSSGFSETTHSPVLEQLSLPVRNFPPAAKSNMERRQAVDDSDDEVDCPRLLPPPASYRVEVVEASYITYREVLRWLHTGDVNFAPLKSAAPPKNLLQQSDDCAITSTSVDEAVPTFTPASPKSIYRLADFLELPELKALALESILDQITVANVIVELMSEVSQLYDPIQEALANFAAKNWADRLRQEGAGVHPAKLGLLPSASSSSARHAWKPGSTILAIHVLLLALWRTFPIALASRAIPVALQVSTLPSAKLRFSNLLFLIPFDIGTFMPHSDGSPEPQIKGGFAPSDVKKINALIDESNEAIAAGSPPHKLLCLPFAKCLRITATLIIILEQPFNLPSFDLAVKTAEQVIHEETDQMSVARAFWIGRSKAVELWVEQGDRSVKFSAEPFTSSNEVLDACFTARDVYPLVNDYAINFKADGKPRRAHYNHNAPNKPSGPADKKATILAARDRAFRDFARTCTAVYNKHHGIGASKANPQDVPSRSASVEVQSEMDEASDAEVGLSDVDVDVVADQRYRQRTEEFEDEVNYEDENVQDPVHASPPPRQQVPLSKRVAPPTLASRLGALADSHNGGSPRPTPVRPKPPKAHHSFRDPAEGALVKRKRPVPEVQYDSDSDSSAGTGASGSVDVSVATYHATLQALYNSRMEPSEGSTALTGLALQTYRMAQCTRAFDKTMFKRTIEASQLSIHPRILEAIAKNEPFDFTCLNTSEASREPEPLAIAALPGVFTAAKPPSRPFTSGLQWARAWSLYTLARKRWYAWEVPDLDAFGDWFIARLEDDEKTIQHYFAFFADRFPKVGTTGNPDTVAGLIHDHPALMRHLGKTASAPVASSSRSGKGGRANSAAKDSELPSIPEELQICRRFNKGDADHDDCVRRHAEWEKSNQGRGFAKEAKEIPKYPFNSEDHPIDSFPLSGTSSIPRLRRNLHFPVTTIPSSPSVDSTLTAEPLPTIPPCVLNDATINATLRARPDLFKVSTPIDIPRFRGLLKTHPNRPLVESVLHGLEFGFWPGHDGDFASIGHKFGPAERLNDKTLDFLAEHSASDFDKGYLSKPFQLLLPGMHVSPDYATDPVNQRPRPINDLTASGLNDGVTKAMAKVRYDAQAELGAVARYRFRKGELRDPANDPVFWKSDVSGGFRNLPVSPYWQLKQVHRVRRRVGNGFVWVYHVDHRLLLGGRMSPRIFCTVMSLVLWATRREFALEFPLAFVDDTFGLDASKVRVSVTHYITKETRLVCLEQAKVLTMWNFLHFPWSWDKQPMGKRQIIIGNIFSLVTADDGSISDMTISLAPESVELYASDVKKFLYRRDGRPKLKEWLSIQGYSSWAVGVLHWGRFALECLYEKTSGKVHQNFPISMNTTVRQDLTWFVNELRTAPPLSLLDPALEHWGVSDAHIILHTDACLLTVDKKSSGLGFWTTINGRRRHFFHRTPSVLKDIRWAEALAVFSAINWAIDKTDSKRIMVFTDSALCVYAFDSGKVALGPMHDLVWSIYSRLASKGIDLRLRHISGEANRTADFLSRGTNSKLASKYGASLSTFAPPAHLLGGPIR